MYVCAYNIYIYTSYHTDSSVPDLACDASVYMMCVCVCMHRTTDSSVPDLTCDASLYKSLEGPLSTGLGIHFAFASATLVTLLPTATH
jgi:hypothetical protein